MKINLTDSISYWSFEWDTNNMDKILSISDDIVNHVNSTYDGHGLWEGVKPQEWIEEQDLGEIGKLILEGIDTCKKIHTKEYESVESSAWVNVIDAKRPKQKIRNLNGSLVYHTHTEISKKMKEPLPDYTFIFYIQMPNNLVGDDGKLFIMDKSGNEIGILPRVGELIILEGDVPHAPVDALNSDVDRIVLAGNVCFIKPQKNKTTLI